MILGIDYLAVPLETKKWNDKKKQFEDPAPEYWPVYLKEPVVILDYGNDFKLAYRYKCPWCPKMFFGYRQALKHMGKVMNIAGDCHGEKAYTKPPVDSELPVERRDVENVPGSIPSSVDDKRTGAAVPTANSRRQKRKATGANGKNKRR